MFLLLVCGQRYLLSHSRIWLFISGFVAGLVITTKQNTAFVAGVLPILILWQIVKKKINAGEGVRRMVLYASGVLIPFALIMFYFLLRGGLNDFFYYSLYSVLGPYRNFQLMTRGDGEFIELGYGLLLIPFMLFWKQLGVRKETMMWLVLLIIALVPSLLPSYLSYRTFTSFALVATVAGYLIRAVWNFKEKPAFRWIMAAAFAGFTALTWRYTVSYVDFVRDNRFAFGQYLTDYGSVEQDFAYWIGKNTRSDDRIMVYGSEMTYLLADRLPVNKYTNFTPYVLQPLGESSGVFIDNPPKAIVFDWAHPDMGNLSGWPFLVYMKEQYQEVKRVDSLVLYVLKR